MEAKDCPKCGEKLKRQEDWDTPHFWCPNCLYVEPVNDDEEF